MLNSKTLLHRMADDSLRLVQKPTRYPGKELRRLNAERGCGSKKRIDPAVRALFAPTKR